MSEKKDEYPKPPLFKVGNQARIRPMIHNAGGLPNGWDKLATVKAIRRSGTDLVGDWVYRVTMEVDILIPERELRAPDFVQEGEDGLMDDEQAKAPKKRRFGRDA